MDKSVRAHEGSRQKKGGEKKVWEKCCGEIEDGISNLASSTLQQRNPRSMSGMQLKVRRGQSFYGDVEPSSGRQGELCRRLHI